MTRRLALGMVVGIGLGGLAVRTGGGPVTPCRPTAAMHERWVMKTRPAPAAHDAEDPGLAIRAPTDTTVAAILALPAPEGYEVHAVGPVDDFEQTLWRLRAYPMLLTLARDDCDIHLEVAEMPDSAADRILVEIPPTTPGLQQLVYADLAVPFGVTRRHFDRPPRLTILGWGFDDLPHVSRAHGTPGWQHGSARVKTTRELHPVVDVGFAP